MIYRYYIGNDLSNYFCERIKLYQLKPVESQSQLILRVGYIWIAVKWQEANIRVTSPQKQLANE